MANEDKALGELLSVLFLSRDIAHKEHLNTDSYAVHMALDGFYRNIIDLADSLAEAYQGKEGKHIGDIPSYANPMKGAILITMKKMLAEVDTKRVRVCPDDSTIQNILDEIVALFYSTIYKLTFLK